MKLSDAILLGRNLCVAAKNPCDETNEEGCALTMASLAVGAQSQYGRNVWHDAKRIWPWLEGEICCPFANCRWGTEADSGYMTIAHIFDSHVMNGHWTLEQLVDHVRSIEPAEPETRLLQCPIGDCNFVGTQEEVEDHQLTEEEWSDSQTMIEMVRSIGVPK